MRLYYVEAVGTPEYINMLEDSKKKAKCVSRPISDDVLIAIATKSFTGPNTLPDGKTLGEASA